MLAQEVRSFVPWLLWASLSLAVAISGPFGSYGQFSFGERLLFWSPVIALSVAVTSLVRAFILSTLNEHDTLRGTLIAAALNCAIVSPPLYLLINGVLPSNFSGSSHIWEIMLLVVTISLGVCALRSAAAAGPSVSDAGSEPQEDMILPPRLMRRVEPAIQGEIWAISVRDHYVDVQTSRGKVSLLMRFSDAIDEVDCQPGAQVHRSHWVAWAGVGSVCREGGKVVLHLKNGHQIPVSRNHRDKVDAQFPPMSSPKTLAA